MPTRVKNWAKFQHFKDRRPPWIKLYRDILDDMNWHKLEPAAAKALVSLWLIASENDGQLPDVETLAFRLRKSDSEIRAIVISLSHWLEHDDNSVTSTRYQVDAPERETERETEKEEKPAAVASARPPNRKKSLKTGMPDGFSISERVRAWASEKGYSNLDAHLDAFRRKASAKGYTYVNWDDAFMEAIREDWAKLRGRAFNGAAPPPESGAGLDPDSRPAIEAEGIAKGIGAWDGIEQFHLYKARVRGKPNPGLGIEALASMAASRQGALQ
jgi:hypothetical protein